MVFLPKTPFMPMHVYSNTFFSFFNYNHDCIFSHQDLETFIDVHIVPLSWSNRLKQIFHFSPREMKVKGFSEGWY